MLKKIVVVLVILVMVAGVGVGVYLMRQSTEYREKAAPASTLSFSTNTPEPEVGQEFYVYSEIDSAENHVASTELFITYDPGRLELISVVPGTFFTNPLIMGEIIDNDVGKLSYALAVPPYSPAVRGKGIVAILSFKAMQEGVVTISYTYESIVGATVDDSGNVLVGTSSLTLTIRGVSEASPTPTETPGDVTATISPSPEPTEPAATFSPNPTLSPEPTDSDSGVGGAAPTATNTPTATLTATPTGVDGGGESGENLTSTNTPTTQPTSAGDELPDSGIAEIAIMGIGIGVFVLFIGLFLAL